MPVCRYDGSNGLNKVFKEQANVQSPGWYKVRYSKTLLQLGEKYDWKVIPLLFAVSEQLSWFYSYVSALFWSQSPSVLQLFSENNKITVRHSA